jgi:hypothetical protein
MLCFQNGVFSLGISILKYSTFYTQYSSWNLANGCFPFTLEKERKHSLKISTGKAIISMNHETLLGMLEKRITNQVNNPKVMNTATSKAKMKLSHKDRLATSKKGLFHPSHKYATSETKIKNQGQ